MASHRASASSPSMIFVMPAPHYYVCETTLAHASGTRSGELHRLQQLFGFGGIIHDSVAQSPITHSVVQQYTGHSVTADPTSLCYTGLPEIVDNTTDARADTCQNSSRLAPSTPFVVIFACRFGPPCARLCPHAMIRGMPFSLSIIKAAWESSGRVYECSNPSHGHRKRCNTRLLWTLCRRLASKLWIARSSRAGRASLSFR